MRTFIPLILLAALLAGCAALPPALQPAGEQPHVQASWTPTLELPTATPAPSFEELLILGQDAGNEGNWTGAIAYLDQAISINAASAQGFYLRGGVYFASGDLEHALADYDAAIALDPALSSAYQSRGLVYAQQGNTDQALADISKAIELAPSFALAYRNRAEIQMSLNNNTAASFDLKAYLGLVPNAPDRAQVESTIAALQEQAVETVGENGLLFADDFSDPASGWYTNGDPASPGMYSDGGYRLIKQQPQGAVWALPGRIFTDVRIDVTATKMGGEDDNWFGVMCRVQGTTQTGNFYVLMISSDGYFGIAKKTGDLLELIGQDKMLLHPSINKGNASNKISAICSGNRLALYVNDEFVVETTDEDFSNGQVGLLAGTFEVSGTDILFDDFAVYAQAPE
jgi:tetratricopeptide (TPR) repeat protein